MRSASRRTRFKYALPDEPIVEHDIGALHEPECLEGQKVGVAGTGADEIHFALLTILGAAGGGIELRVELRDRFSLVAGEHQIDDRPLEDSFPEAPPLMEIFEAAPDLLSVATDEGGDPAVGGGQQRFKPCLDHAAEDRRGAGGGNGDHDGRAVDNRRHREIAQLGHVDDIAGDTSFACDRMNFTVLLDVLRGAVEQRASIEVLSKRLARHEAELLALLDFPELLAQLRGEHLDLRACPHGHLRLARRSNAAAENRDNFVIHVEEDRKLIHQL